MTRFPDSAESIEAKVIGPRLAAWLESHWHERDVLDLPPPSKQRRCQRKLPPPNGLLTRAQAATKLNCSLRTLDGHVASGTLRYVNIGHGEKRPRRMFTDADLDEFIANQTRKDVPCPSAATGARHTGPTTSKSTVIGFMEAQRRRRDAKRKR